MIDARAEMQLRRLKGQRDQLLKEIEALKNKIAGLEMAIRLIGEVPAQDETAPSSLRRVHVSETIVDLLATLDLYTQKRFFDNAAATLGRGTAVRT